MSTSTSVEAELLSGESCHGVVVHDDWQAGQEVSAETLDALAARRRTVSGYEQQQRSRYFPVLSVLAPVMSQLEGEITYPGDPMCLYAALSVAVHRAVDDAGPAAQARHYNDVAPEWTHTPSLSYRLNVGYDGIRPFGKDPNTDQTVFDPRVWDANSRTRWIHLLRMVQPRVVLISSVSPAHRHALEIATLVKIEAPQAIVVLGGRHVDETVSYNTGLRSLRLAPSSPLSVMAEAKVPRVIDIVVSGEAYFTVDVLMRALALSVDLESGWVNRADIVPRLRTVLAMDGSVPGNSLLVVRNHDQLHAFPLSGPAVDLTELPSPYEAHAIRSRFDIFTDPVTGRGLLTAHLMVSNACPYRCNFCSESSQLAGGLKKMTRTSAAVARVLEYVSYGAESLFFDDSVFWSGTFRDALDFCRELHQIQTSPLDDLDLTARRFIRSPEEHERLQKLQWGAQFTVDQLSAMHSPEKVTELLEAMKASGCNYIYIGIESMSSQVMDHIHKNLRRTSGRTWADKVRTALSLVKGSGIRVGTSVLFGLTGEDRTSINETIDAIAELIGQGLIDLASPNILTYHPATAVTKLDGVDKTLDYHSPNLQAQPPYIYFEEAFPGVISVRLSEDDLWYIHEQTSQRWGVVRHGLDAEAAEELVTA